MFKRGALLILLALMITGCSSEEETEGTTGGNGTEEGIEEGPTEEEWPDYENMTNDELNEFFGSMSDEELEEYVANMSDEEFAAYMAGVDWSEFEDEDGNPLFGEEGIRIYTEEDAIADMEAAYQASYQSEERGSGINPAAVGETITRDVNIIDLETTETYPGKIEMTHLGTIYGDEAWDILSENEANLLFLEEPIDFDYVISEMEVTLIEGEEEVGFLIPSFLKTADYDGNTLGDQSPAALLGNPLLDLDREGFDLYEGETVSGQIVTMVPKGVDFMLELQYNATNEGAEFAFFELE